MHTKELGMSDEKERFHNQGQQDASEGRYNPPGSILPFTPDRTEENRAYRDGYFSTQGQKDKAANTLTNKPGWGNPFGPNADEVADNEAYNKGRNS